MGAFDTFGKNRATLLNAIDQVLDDISDIEQDGFIFDVLTPKASYEEKEELPDHMLSEYEKEYLGFYKLANAQDNKPIFVQIDQFKRIRTKNGQNMAFVTLNDGINNLDGVVFPDTFKKYEIDLNTSKMLVVRGKFENRNNKQQLILNQVDTMDHFEQTKFDEAQQVVVRKWDSESKLDQLLTNDKGQNQIPVNYFDESQNNIETIGFITRDNEILSKLIQRLSPRDIRII